MFPALHPLSLLDYPAEDVFELINEAIDFNDRNDKDNPTTKNGVIRKKAGDNWF